MGKSLCNIGRALEHEALFYDDKRQPRPKAIGPRGDALLEKLDLGHDLRYMLLARYLLAGYDFVSASPTNIVVQRNGETVLKLLRVDVCPGEGLEQQRVQEAVSLVTDALPGFAVQTTVKTKPRALYPWGSQTILQQPFVHGNSLGGLYLSSKIVSVLHDFATESLHTLVANGVTPNVTGQSVRIVSGDGDVKLRLLSTLPLVDARDPRFAQSLARLKRFSELKSGDYFADAIQR